MDICLLSYKNGIRRLSECYSETIRIAHNLELLVSEFEYYEDLKNKLKFHEFLYIIKRIFIKSDYEVTYFTEKSELLNKQLEDLMLKRDKLFKEDEDLSSMILDCLDVIHNFNECDIESLSRSDTIEYVKLSDEEISIHKGLERLTKKRFKLLKELGV